MSFLYGVLVWAYRPLNSLKRCGFRPGQGGEEDPVALAWAPEVRSPVSCGWHQLSQAHRAAAARLGLSAEGWRVRTPEARLDWCDAQASTAQDDPVAAEDAAAELGSPAPLAAAPTLAIAVGGRIRLLAEAAERTMEERAAAELHSPLTGLAFSPWPELGVSADGLGWSRMPLCVGVDTRVVFSRFRAS